MLSAYFWPSHYFAITSYWFSFAQSMLKSRTKFHVEAVIGELIYKLMLWNRFFPGFGYVPLDRGIKFISRSLVLHLLYSFPYVYMTVLTERGFLPICIIYTIGRWGHIWSICSQCKHAECLFCGAKSVCWKINYRQLLLHGKYFWGLKGPPLSLHFYPLENIAGSFVANITPCTMWRSVKKLWRIYY